jgi:protein tyrosine phosphatase (PTP) superfamily phosphohydrolase (DUF442 family)
MAIDEVKNFVQVGERLATAGQPSEEQLREVAAAGYRAVINLGLLDPRYCLPDEAALVLSLGLSYCHIPVQFDAPRREDFDAFVAAMDAQGQESTFVHCAANYRVSAFVALYGELRLGWTRDQADACIHRVWEPNETWQRFLAECRSRFTPGSTGTDAAKPTSTDRRSRTSTNPATSTDKHHQ